jgi:hypothetical protein
LNTQNKNKETNDVLEKKEKNMKILADELGRRMMVIEQLKKNNDLINKNNKENMKKIEELNKEKKKIK